MMGDWPFWPKLFLGIGLFIRFAGPWIVAAIVLISAIVFLVKGCLP